MTKKEYIYPMSIKKVSECEYLVSSPIEELSITGSASSFGEAVKMAKSLLEFALFDNYENEGSFPKKKGKELMAIENTKKTDEIILYISTNLEQILNAFGTEPVEKMISIPQYQDFWLKENGVSPSKLLQEAIENRIVMS